LAGRAFKMDEEGVCDGGERNLRWRRKEFAMDEKR
jgi:hypothetical protein